MYHHYNCRRRYRLWKLIADLILLSLTGGFWVAYILWRFVRTDNCCCRHYPRWTTC